MRRSISAATVALVTAGTLTGATVAAGPANAGRPGHGALVTGTYSTGAAHGQPLPSVRVGDGADVQAAATVVVDPSRTRQSYTGI